MLVLGAIVCALWFYPWLAPYRLAGALGLPQAEIAVTSPEDAGPGSLREAMFAALRAAGPVSIIVRVDKIVLDTPLPPLAGAYGVTIRAEDAPCIIDAGRLRGVPVFDVRGRASIDNLEIRGARTYGVLVSSAATVSLSRLRVSASDIGVGAAGNYELTISDSVLMGNRVGIELLGPGAAQVASTTFSDHEEAGVWAVGLADPSLDIATLDVAASRFEGGRYGLVVVNSAAQLSDNDISEFSDDGVLVLGGFLEAARNRIWNGRGAAIRSVGIAGARLTGNDIHENERIGILVQAASVASVDDNRVYRNGYGIVTVRNQRRGAVSLSSNLVVGHAVDGLVVIGDSPTVTENRMLGNGAAGIRVLSLVLPDGYVGSSPLLVGNVLDRNLLDEPVFADYRPPRGAGR